MKYVLLIVVFGCSVREDPKCQSGPAKQDLAFGPITPSCDYRAHGIKLADGSVFCVCPEDVTEVKNSL